MGSFGLGEALAAGIGLAVGYLAAAWWYERRYQKALELEREREQAVRYGQINRGGW